MIDDTIRNIFADGVFKEFHRYRLYGEVNGARIGVVLATRTPRFSTFALNKFDFDRLIAAKQDGRLDSAFVVMAAIDASGARTYCEHHAAEHFNATVVANRPLHHGQFGDFYALPSDEEPF